MFCYLYKMTFFQINLSHNLLTYVPANLPILLSQIVQLDLSKNQLVRISPVFTVLRLKIGFLSERFLKREIPSTSVQKGQNFGKGGGGMCFCRQLFSFTTKSCGIRTYDHRYSHLSVFFISHLLVKLQVLLIRIF
jgi:hypothetical protein